MELGDWIGPFSINITVNKILAYDETKVFSILTQV